MRSPAFRSGCPGLSDTSLGPTRITTTKTTTTRMSSKNFKDNKITCRKQPEELLKEHCRNLFVAALVVVSPPRGSLALRGSSPLCPRPAPGARPKRDGMCSYSLQSLSLCLHAVFLSRSENIAVCRPPLGALLYIDISIYLSIYLSIDLHMVFRSTSSFSDDQARRARLSGRAGLGPGALVAYERQDSLQTIVFSAFVLSTKFNVDVDQLLIMSMLKSTHAIVRKLPGFQR